MELCLPDVDAAVIWPWHQVWKTHTHTGVGPGKKRKHFVFFSLKDFIYLCLERGREGEREGEKHQCVVASHTPPTGDLACNPGMCPDWESNQRPFGSQAGTQSTEPHQPGLTFYNSVVNSVHHATLHTCPQLGFSRGGPELPEEPQTLRSAFEVCARILRTLSQEG